MKHCLQYSRDGVWLGFNKPRVPLPATITRLFDNWATSESKTRMKIFRRYLPDFALIRGEDETHFIFESSLKKCKDLIREHTSKLTRDFVLPKVEEPHIIDVLPQLLDKKSSMALMTMTMSRIEPKNRMSNATFSTALKCKLGLPIILNHQEYKCHSGKWVDAYGDHCLGCRPNGKTAASNDIRDSIISILKRVLPLTKLIQSASQLRRKHTTSSNRFAPSNSLTFLSDVITFCWTALGAPPSPAWALTSP
jgi:hypothetical protein